MTGGECQDLRDLLSYRQFVDQGDTPMATAPPTDLVRKSPVCRPRCALICDALWAGAKDHGGTWSEHAILSGTYRG
jgi:hypothetical protein